jgi:RNA polymerase sigma factor (sigma-70 family)
VGRRPVIDRREVEELYKTYGPLVRRRARGILGDDQEALDATQEVFVRVIASMAEFRGQSQPSTWLYRITTNLCLNRIRDGRRRRERLAEVAESRATDQASTAPGSENRAALRDLLARLPEDLAQVAVYYHVDEMDQAEIAVLLGVARRTVGYRLDRFREEAQALLQRTGPASAETDDEAAAGPRKGVSKALGDKR